MVDFASIVGAVKPRQRTSQLQILAALYSLGAHSTPVTSSQVVELIRLHFGKKVPANVPTRLRRYSRDVCIAAKGPPLQWRLTDKGVEKLRRTSGLDLAREPAREEFGADIAIICALDHPELSAVMAALGGAAKCREIGNPKYTHIYREAEIVTEAGKRLKVVTATSTSMGLTAASIVTTQLVF